MGMTADRDAPQPCFIIAEAGVNHNGSLALAKQLVDAAADARADAIKFQSFSTERLVTRSARKAQYQRDNVGGPDQQAEMLRALELPRAAMLELRDHAAARGIELMSTPFDPGNLTFLVGEVGVKRIKIPSGEIVNGPLLLAAARSGLPVVISTGMSTMAEIEEALSVLAWGMEDREGRPAGRAELRELRRREGWLQPLQDRVWIMHCVTQYPAPADITNLRAVDFLRDRTGLPTGLSDHSTGRHIALAAIARGARVLEKHMTLSRDMPGPDHKASLEPAEFHALVDEVRDIESALGTYDKRPQEIEKRNIEAARGSLVADRPIRAGERFTADNLTIKRPGLGISPLEYWDHLSGLTAARDFQADELIVSAADRAQD
jgi:N-acetylneuraminate synthase